MMQNSNGDEVHYLTYQRLMHISEWLKEAHGISIDEGEP